MIVSVHQPAYLPWLGYFDRIARSDVFVFLDTVQFEKNSFTNRNRIKTANGPLWLTVPVKLKGHIDKSLIEIKIDNSQNWRDKHLRSIEQAYKKAPGFSVFFEELTKAVSFESDTIAALCWEQLNLLVDLFGVQTKLVRASDLDVNARKSELVRDICVKLGASTYISGALGRDYLDLASFDEKNIDVKFQSFQSPQYPQLHGQFIPNLSAIDYVFNMPDKMSVGKLFK
jgi:hypothetical protein